MPKPVKTSTMLRTMRGTASHLRKHGHNMFSLQMMLSDHERRAKILEAAADYLHRLEFAAKCAIQAIDDLGFEGDAMIEVYNELADALGWPGLLACGCYVEENPDAVRIDDQNDDRGFHEVCRNCYAKGVR